MSTDDKFAAGIELRRDMWGEDAAEKRMASAPAFVRPFEDLVTTYCFGDVWNREGLDRKTRSIVTLAVLTALTKPNQLRVHVKGAIANGVSVEEIREVIMHSAVYAGIPTGVEAMNPAMDVLKEMELMP
jgi:4-carboxymuconolactone decarboxylase